MTEITGKVVHGEHFGKTLGFPTANLDRREYVRKKLKIKLGVWAGGVEVRGKGLEVRKYKAGIVIGPPDRHRLPKIEAHLIGYKGNLYGKKITLILKKYIRPFKRYKSIEVLKSVIKKDINKIRKMPL